MIPRKKNPLFEWSKEIRYRVILKSRLTQPCRAFESLADKDDRVDAVEWRQDDDMYSVVIETLNHKTYLDYLFLGRQDSRFDRIQGRARRVKVKKQ